MLDFSVKSGRTICIRHCAGIFGLAFLIFFSKVSASFSPPPETRQAHPFANTPRNYCSANVAALGTGLVPGPVPSGTKNGTQKGRLWTGWIRASASGKYEFILPDGVGLISLNRQQIFARPTVSSKPAVTQIQLLTNRYYAITVETTRSGTLELPLQWRRPDGRHETVPKAYLYAPVSTARASDTKNGQGPYL